MAQPAAHCGCNVHAATTPPCHHDRERDRTARPVKWRHALTKRTIHPSCKTLCSEPYDMPCLYDKQMITNSRTLFRMHAAALLICWLSPPTVRTCHYVVTGTQLTWQCKRKGQKTKSSTIRVGTSRDNKMIERFVCRLRNNTETDLRE